MTARAGIVVTGTEVLSGRARDRNGPWLADRLDELGVELAYVTIVGDRPDDMETALRFMAERDIDLVLMSGGLGPTADDITAEVVGRFQARPMVLDEALAGRIEAIVRPLLTRRPNLDPEAIRVGTRKQATIPEGATVLEPVGTAPGLVVPPPGSGEAGGPTVVVLPGPPRELQPMWSAAVQADALREAIRNATVYEQRTLRLFGIPESEIAETLRVAERDGVELGKLEVTTCLKRGEIEVVTRYEPDSAEVYEAFARVVAERHAGTLFSTDGSTVDEQVAGMLGEREWAIAVAEVLHRGRAGGATDRPRGRVAVRRGRRGRVLQRGEGRAGGRRSEADRAARSGVRAGRAGAGRGRARADGSRRGGGGHGRGGPWWRHRGQAGGPCVAERGRPAGRGADALGEPAGCSRRRQGSRDDGCAAPPQVAAGRPSRPGLPPIGRRV